LLFISAVVSAVLHHDVGVDVGGIENCVVLRRKGEDWQETGDSGR